MGARSPNQLIWAVQRRDMELVSMVLEQADAENCTAEEEEAFLSFHKIAMQPAIYQQFLQAIQR
jgi:hypothetical protein